MDIQLIIVISIICLVEVLIVLFFKDLENKMDKKDFENRLKNLEEDFYWINKQDDEDFFYDLDIEFIKNDSNK